MTHITKYEIKYEVIYLKACQPLCHCSLYFLNWAVLASEGRWWQVHLIQVNLPCSNSPVLSKHAELVCMRRILRQLLRYRGCTWSVNIAGAWLEANQTNSPMVWLGFRVRGLGFVDIQYSSEITGAKVQWGTRSMPHSTLICVLQSDEGQRQLQ